LAVPQFLDTVEQTSFSTWLRETPSLFGFYFVLMFHTIGLSMLVGASAVVDLRILGVAANLPLRPFKSLFPIMWAGLAVNVVSGLLLLLAYPTKALTNPLFYLKLTFIAIAVTVVSRIYKNVFADATLSDMAMMAKGKTLAICSLLLWVATIYDGRVLSETAKYLLYGNPNAG
jgi:hypothetical protein